MATPCAAVKVASKGVTWNRVAGIPYVAIRRRFASACGISDSPGPLSHYSAQDGSVEQPWDKCNQDRLTAPIVTTNIVLSVVMIEQAEPALIMNGGSR